MFWEIRTLGLFHGRNSHFFAHVVDIGHPTIAPPAHDRPQCHARGQQSIGTASR